MTAKLDAINVFKQYVNQDTVKYIPQYTKIQSITCPVKITNNNNIINLNKLSRDNLTSNGNNIIGYGITNICITGMIEKVVLQLGFVIVNTLTSDTNISEQFQVTCNDTMIPFVDYHQIELKVNLLNNIESDITVSWDLVEIKTKNDVYIYPLNKIIIIRAFTKSNNNNLPGIKSYELDNNIYAVKRMQLKLPKSVKNVYILCEKESSRYDIVNFCAQEFIHTSNKYNALDQVQCNKYNFVKTHFNDDENIWTLTNTVREFDVNNLFILGGNKELFIEYNTPEKELVTKLNIYMSKWSIIAISDGFYSFPV